MNINENKSNSNILEKLTGEFDGLPESHSNKIGSKFINLAKRIGENKMSELNLKNNISCEFVGDYKFFCSKCGDGDTPEEHQEFLDAIYDSGNYVINDNFVVDDYCKKCECNLFTFIGGIRITKESVEG